MTWKTQSGIVQDVQDGPALHRGCYSSFQDVQTGWHRDRVVQGATPNVPQYSQLLLPYVTVQPWPFARLSRFRYRPAAQRSALRLVFIAIIFFTKCDLRKMSQLKKNCETFRKKTFFLMAISWFFPIKLERFLFFKGKRQRL